MGDKENPQPKPAVDESKEPVLCPIAAIKGCRGCPFFKTCPVKETFGNYRPSEEERAAMAAENDGEGRMFNDLSDRVKDVIRDVAESGRRDLEEAAAETRKRLRQITGK